MGDLEGDALVLGALGGQVGRAEVAGAVADVGVAVEAQPTTAKSFAPATAFGLFSNPCSFAQFGTRAISSDPSASFAVAPL